MASKNIVAKGTTYNGVESVTFPVSGGGNATFYEVSDTTAGASDVASGKYFYTSSGVKTQGTASGGSANIQSLSVTQNGTYTASGGVDGYSPVTVNVSGGGGGASNVVTGTFTGTTTGAAMDVTLNYTGSGYPVAVVIYPSGGAYNIDAPSGTNAYAWYNLIQRYAIGYFCFSKSEMDTTPTYGPNGNNNQAVIIHRYKNTSSSAISYALTGSDELNTYNDTNAVSTNSGRLAVRIRSKTKMSVYIASTSYGFAANIEYKYWVLYSS